MNETNHLIKSEYTNTNQYDFNKPPFCQGDSFYQQTEVAVGMQPSNYNSYMSNLPPTPGISPPNSQQFQQSHHLNLNNINSPNTHLISTPTSKKDNQIKGRPKKRKANSDGSTQSKKMPNKNVSAAKQSIPTTAAANSSTSTTIKNEAVTSKMTTNSVTNTVSSPPQQTHNLLGTSDSPDDYSKNFDSNLGKF